MFLECYGTPMKEPTREVKRACLSWSSLWLVTISIHKLFQVVIFIFLSHRKRPQQILAAVIA